MSRIRGNATYANVMSTLALFVALGGVSYAAVRLPAGSVGTKQLRDGSVTPAKLSRSAVTSLRGKQGPRGTQGPQGTPGLQGPAGAAGPAGMSGLDLRWFKHTAELNRASNMQTVDIRCDPGWVPVSGGWGLGAIGLGDEVIGSTPTLPGIGPTGGDNGNFSGWSTTFSPAPGPGTLTVDVHVLCAAGRNAGAGLK